MGNKFLSQIRNVDAIIHVVRCFDSKDITHVDGDVNPVRDIETINTELILKDIESIDKRINNVTKIAKSGDKNAKTELDLLNKINNHLNEGDLIINLKLTDEEKVILKSFALLTSRLTSGASVPMPTLPVAEMRIFSSTDPTFSV